MWKIIPGVLFCHLLVFVSFAEESVQKKGGVVTCGQNSTHAAGGFHLSITNLTGGECKWYITPNITVKTPPKINLFFTFLYLHENDIVTVYNQEEDIGNTSLSIIDPLIRQNGSVTIMTEESKLFIHLRGNDTSYQRKFVGMFQSQTCAFPISPDLTVIHSPLTVKFNSPSAECKYTYNEDLHYRNTPAFFFEEYAFTSSQVLLSESTSDSPYKHDPPIDFFPKSDNPMVIDVQMKKIPSNESFILGMHMVDRDCYGHYRLSTGTISIKSPNEIFDNGTIISECRWIFENSDSSMVLGVVFDQLNFEDPFDIIAVNNGGSFLSPPLLQVTTSNRNSSQNLLTRSTRPYLWIGFKPKDYASKVVINVTVHGQGGYYKGSGKIQMKSTVGNDSVFLLEVEEGKVVLLNFTKSNFPLPATLSIYDGFDKTNLLATLHGNVWYPVISRSSKMMVVATSFQPGSFEATFNGTTSGCLHMGTFSNENYVLSGNCNRTCLWVIPPQDQAGYVLLLNLQFLSLNKGDQITLYKLDSARTSLGEISSSANHVPQLSIPANVGALVEISRAACSTKTDDVVLVGHSSYLPACGKDLNPTSGVEFQITSPLYPDTYPLFDSCRWKIATAKDNLVYLAFKSLQLAPNHCVKITHSDNKTDMYEGNELKEDLLVIGEALVEFDSTNCKSSKVESLLLSSDGFVLNGTVTNCGGVLSGKASGDFSVPVNKTLCIWKVSIPDTQASYISYTINKKDEKGNFKLSVYDGSSVRDTPITNDSVSEIWSRSSNLIFVYRSIDATKPSSVLNIKYSTQKCNETMMCENKICMHPDWMCNGINDCGDFTDEKNCASLPVPHVDVPSLSYSATSFWVSFILMFLLGAALGIGIPYAYDRYKNGQYRRFGDISVIE